MVLASNGGAVAAAHAALEFGVAGSLSSGLHHAGYGSGAGFCTFNGLAIAAKAALAAGAKSVLILDLDAHCGGGTASLIADEPRIRQLDVSVSSYDSYQESEQSRLVMVGTGSEYLPAVRRVLDEADRQGASFDLCLYNAGMDPSEDCSTGGQTGITRDMLAERERLVFEWCRLGGCRSLSSSPEGTSAPASTSAGWSPFTASHCRLRARQAEPGAAPDPARMCALGDV